jgi:hypothetical protein
MITELYFQLCVSASAENAQWWIPKTAQAQPPQYYQIYIPLRESISYLTFQQVRAKVKVIAQLENRPDFRVVHKELDSRLSHPPQNLNPLLKLLDTDDLMLLKYCWEGLSYEETAQKLFITEEAVRKQCYRLGLKTGISVKEWIWLCTRRGKLFE